MAEGLLFDTHVLLWFLSGDERLSEAAKDCFANDSINKYASVASAMEVSIKISIGKLTIKGAVKQFWEDVLACGLSELPIAASDCYALQNMRLIHKDPFDRLLVSTAIQRKLKVVTNDANIKKYSIETIW